MIGNNLLRFTIPFHLSDNNNDKKKIFLSLEKMGWKQEHIVQGENDLYEYITDLVNDSMINDVASSWKLPKDFYKKRGFVTKMNQQEINWNIEQVGLVLFSTGVGILWYEINTSKITEFTQIMDITYALKELARGKREDNYIQFGEKVAGEDDPKILEWEKDDAIQIIEKKSTPQGLIVKGLKKINLFTDVLFDFISDIKIDTYFANRLHEKEICPDRAIPFSWVYEISENTIEDGLDKTFHLGRAYKSSYDMSSRINVDDFYIPFDDSIWYASLEGCGNYTYPNLEKPFYTSGYETRLNTYFYLYILCLGQYYSLLQLAQEVSMLPTDETKYSSKDDRLEKILDKIHVFNLKNNYSQVGHLTQHNEFYEYLQKRLGINKMQQELEVELQALFEMIERKKAIKQAKNYQVITIIGGIFVVLQAFINVAAMYGSAINGEWGYFVFATVGCVILSIIGVIIWLLTLIEKRKKRKRWSLWHIKS